VAQQAVTQFPFIDGKKTLRSRFSALLASRCRDEPFWWSPSLMLAVLCVTKRTWALWKNMS